MTHRPTLQCQDVLFYYLHPACVSVLCIPLVIMLGEYIVPSTVSLKDTSTLGHPQYNLKGICFSFRTRTVYQDQSRFDERLRSIHSP